jgi:CHAD domain-containing protein
MTNVKKILHILTPMNIFDPISTVVQDLGSQLLREAKKNADDLGGSDEEALHDFRVSVRRLRSFLRSYEAYIKNAKKHRQRLSAIMTLTNSGRDHEVHVAWLKDKQSKADPLEQDGITYLLEHLSSTEHVDLKRVKKDFDEAAKKLARVFPQAEEGDTEVNEETPSNKKAKEKTFAAVTAVVLQDYSSELQSLLASIKKPDDEAIHEARIAGKRLRYTLELLDLEEAKTLVKALKKFQDITGNLHDLQVLEPKVQTFLFAETVLWSQAFRDGSKTLSHKELSQLPELQKSYGLAALQRSLEREKTALYTDLQENWLSAVQQDFFAKVRALIQQLLEKREKIPSDKKAKSKAGRKTTSTKTS